MVSTRRSKNQQEPAASSNAATEPIPKKKDPPSVSNRSDTRNRALNEEGSIDKAAPLQSLPRSGTNRSRPNQDDEDHPSSEASSSEGQRSTSEARPTSILKKISNATVRVAGKLASIASPRRRAGRSIVRFEGLDNSSEEDIPNENDRAGSEGSPTSSIYPDGDESVEITAEAFSRRLAPRRSLPIASPVVEEPAPRQPSLFHRAPRRAATTNIMNEGNADIQAVVDAAVADATNNQQAQIDAAVASAVASAVAAVLAARQPPAQPQGHGRDLVARRIDQNAQPRVQQGGQQITTHARTGQTAPPIDSLFGSPGRRDQQNEEAESRRDRARYVQQKVGANASKFGDLKGQGAEEKRELLCKNFFEFLPMVTPVLFDAKGESTDTWPRPRAFLVILDPLKPSNSKGGRRPGPMSKKTRREREAVIIAVQDDATSLDFFKDRMKALVQSEWENTEELDVHVVHNVNAERLISLGDQRTKGTGGRRVINETGPTTSDDEEKEDEDEYAYRSDLGGVGASMETFTPMKK
jgi:hypothetical protein